MTVETTAREVLHVGCGQHTLERMPEGFRDGGWREIRYDISPDARPDILGSITDMSAVASGSVDAVYSSHNIEHVYPHEVPVVLAEFRRVLKPGGFVAITCPDLESVAASIVRNGLDQPLYTAPAGAITPIDVLYGHVASIAGGATYMAHRTGFSRDTLRVALKKAGFGAVAVIRRDDVFDLWAIAMNDDATRDELLAMVRRYTRVRFAEESAA